MDRKKDDIWERRSKLSLTKQALLKKRLRGEFESDSRLKVIPRRSSTEPALLSFAQQRLWFLHQLDPASAAYNKSAFVRLTGSLNIAVLQQSINEIVRRHESLRTTFKIVEGQPFQVITPSLKIILPIIDLQNLPEIKLGQEIQRLTTEEAQRVFNLAQEPLLRIILLHLSKTEYLVQFTLHHIIMDGWSVGVLIRELAVLYKVFCAGLSSPLPELPIQYADFALWQRQWLQTEVLEVEIAYWKQQLSNLPMLQLPTDYPRPSVQTFQGARQSVVLPKALSEDLKILSQQEGVTLFMTLLATFQTLLYWYTNQDDIVVGTDIANRNRSEIEGLIGFFVNQLVLRTDLSGNPSFRGLLGRVRDCTLSAFAHQNLPFDKLVDVLKPERTLNRMPLFQVKFVLQSTPVPPLQLSGLTVSTLNEVDIGEATLDLFLLLVDTEQEIEGFLEYDIDLFDASSIARILRHFQILLTTVVKQPDTRLNELVEIIAKVDKQERLTNKTKRKEAYYHKLKSVQRKSVTTKV